MKTISIALAGHLAGKGTTMATCLLITLPSGEIRGFTSNNDDILFGGVMYLAGAYSATDVKTSSALNVDNMEVHGVLNSVSINEADLIAGLWDYAGYHIFDVNREDLSQGALIKRVGHLGEVSLIERGQFVAELLGLMKAYQTVIGELTLPLCSANLFDFRCKVDPAPWTVAGAIEGINPDGVTLYDSSRTEPGPVTGVAIVEVTSADPGHVVLANGSLHFVEGEAITLSGIVGPAILNQVTVAHPVDATALSLGIDTRDLPDYVSGGRVTPMGADAGYFQYGVITMTGGLNTGFSMEVKGYEPGQITLQLPFPYAVEIGDTYTMKAGCSKDPFLACRDKFDNLNNFRGKPYVPGNDKLLSIARRGG